MNFKEQLKAKLKELGELKDKLVAGEDVQEQINTAMDEIEGLKAKIEAAEKAEKLLAGAGIKEGKEPEAGEEKPAKSLGEHFVKTLQEKGHAKRFNISAPSFKAASDIQASPAAAVDWATTFDRNVVTAPRIALVIRDLFGAETISGSTLQYLVEGAIEGAPAVTAEGAEKPQVHFADPTPKTVTLEKIACHIKEADEYIDDYPFLASVINGRLLYELGLVEQNTLVARLLATSGIQTDSTTWTASSTETDIADLILQSAMDVQDQSGFAADGIVMNPAVWYALRVGKDGENRYYGGGYFGGQDIPNLWGIPVCVTPAVTASQIVVGAFKTCGSVVSKGGVSVEATNTNEDDFIKNLMTIRAEERLALAVRRPAGFKLLTK